MKKRDALQPKKPIIRRWWIWVILALMIPGVMMLLWLVGQSQVDENNGSVKNGTFSSNQLRYDERIIKTFMPESGAAFKYNSPLLYEEHLYLGTSERTGYEDKPISEIHDNYFYKLDLDFNIIWQYPLQKMMVTGNAAMDSNHNLYFLTELVTENPSYKPGDKIDKNQKYYSKVELYSLTPNGKLRWHRQVSPEGEYWSRSMNGVAVSVDNLIYFGKERFFAFDTEGNQVGQYPENDQKFNGYNGAPITDSAGNVYFISPDPVNLGEEFTPETIKAFKFSPRLAELEWATTIGNELTSELDPNIFIRRGSDVESTPALGVGEKSLIGIVGCTISKLDTETGELIWSTKPDGIIGFINASPAIDSDGNIFVGSKANQYSKFFAIRSNGTLLWRRDVGADLYNSPLIGDDNTIYVGSESSPPGKFHAYDRLTGAIKWEISGENEKEKEKETKIPDFSYNSGALYEGYVYIGVHSSEKGKETEEFSPTLYKIKVDANGYLPESAWPRIYGGNANNGR